MKKTKEWFCLLLSGLLLMVCSSCTVKVKQSENRPATSDYMKITTLTIAGAGLHLDSTNASDEKLMESYEKSSGIQINWKRSAHLEEENEYLEYLSLLTAAGTLPDLLIFPNLAEMNEKKLLTDLDQYIKADSDWNQIPMPLQKAVSFSGTTAAVPLRYYIEGYFVNRSLFEKEKITAPTKDSNFTRFFAAVKALSDKQGDFLALSRFSDLPLWYPTIQDSPALWGAYRQNGFEMSHKSLLDGISYASQLRASAYPDKKPEEIPRYSDSALLKQWQSGKIACYYGSSRNIGQIAAVSFAFSYIGIPTGKIVIDADYIGITHACTVKEEAYSLLKWLSFGQNGVQTRYQNPDTMLNCSPPITNNTKLMKAYLEAVPDEGIAQMTEALPGAVVKGDDYIPLYHIYMKERAYPLSFAPDKVQTVSAWINDAINGVFSYPKYAKELNDLVNWKEGTASSPQ